MTFNERTVSQAIYDGVFRVQPDVLNANTQAKAPLEGRLDVALRRAMGAIQAESINTETGKVDYDGLKQSTVVTDYRALTAHLRTFDLKSLHTDDEKKAFWLNLYNALVLDGIIAYGVRHSVTEISGFFRRVAYDVGGFRFSLDDIEHGILRANRWHPIIPQNQFGQNDPRNAFIASALDNRIHFALVCGANSCPPIAFYDSTQLDSQLTRATQHFIAQQVHINTTTRTITLSKLWQWYGQDFGTSAFFKLGLGNPRPVLAFIRTYCPESLKTTLQNALLEAYRVQFAPYDWGLNHA